MDCKAKLASLTQTVALINGADSLDFLLKNLAETACAQIGWEMSSIMSIDVEHGFAHVLARHDPTLLQHELPERWELATSPALVALKRNQQVYIRDIRESDEFHAYRIESYKRDYRTVLVIPMKCVDFGGKPMVLTLLSREVKEISNEDQLVLDMVVQLGIAAVGQERRVQSAQQEALRQDQALKTHTALLDHALAEQSVLSLCELINTQLRIPMVVVDFTVSDLVAWRTPNSSLFDDITWQAEVHRIFGSQISKIAKDLLERKGPCETILRLDNGTDFIQFPVRVQPLIVDASTVGALVIFKQSEPEDLLDLLMLDSARFALSVMMMRSFIRFSFETRTQAELFLEIIESRWRDQADVMIRAKRLGFDFTRSHKLLVIGLFSDKREPGNMIDLHRALVRIVDGKNSGISVLNAAGALVCFCPLQPDDTPERLQKLAKLVAREVGSYLGETPVVAVSQICTKLSDYAEAWDRCQRVVAIARSLGQTGALSMQDFGPLPMLASAAGVDEVQQFLADVLGEVIEHDRDKDTPYMQTLEIYLRERGRSQSAADALGLHVTTLRYRLKRIEDLFGINIEAPESRFSVELAIRMHQMIANS
jgi:purine catabolism regulator